MPSSRRRIRRIARRSGEGSSCAARSSASAPVRIQQRRDSWRVPTRLPDRAASPRRSRRAAPTSSARASQSASIGSVSSSDPGRDHHRDGLHPIEVAACSSMLSGSSSSAPAGSLVTTRRATKPRQLAASRSSSPASARGTPSPTATASAPATQAARRRARPARATSATRAGAVRQTPSGVAAAKQRRPVGRGEPIRLRVRRERCPASPRSAGRVAGPRSSTLRLA